MLLLTLTPFLINMISCQPFTKGFVKDQKILSEKYAKTLIHCGALCKATDECAAFDFEKLNQKCQMISFALKDESESLTEMYIDPTAHSKGA